MPFAAKPEQCLDLITPHDMHSSLACAWSGSFLVSGGLIADIWGKSNAKTFLWLGSPGTGEMLRLVQFSCEPCRCICRSCGMSALESDSSCLARFSDGPLWWSSSL